MKVMIRETLKFLPGKMLEGTKLLKRSLALSKEKIGCSSPIRKYSPWLGGGSSINTIIVEAEYDSLTQMEEFLEKSIADPEMMEINRKWETILESSKEELYRVMP
ncbi:hypothetical protein AC477_00325 [miscellaneous Crenarchaeota group-1 archaeon SG8-32-1]|uniref:NIPSNAP domain-containing protein n=1 Tax=miscellaneous Crenarchaeota group-1 archaeon SG8-32-1 TaxID=1685124 RepID=A0A0M0C2I5_9ARCH|nr:MAG: hypothetical protein AC477_00325 [miscellaneous Crenarchaeota group-1 archaeon SG8-32-1]